MSTIGERIKEIRINSSMTQKDFAEKISVSRPRKSGKNFW